MPARTLQGHFLIASPHLLDPNFARAVVLLIQHSDEGALGVVLNRPTAKTIQELWEEVEEGPCDNRRHLNLGGPVSGPLMALHAQADLSELEVVPGVYFSAEKTHLDSLVKQDQQAMKLFLGHSGWGAGQLEKELSQGAWFTLPATAEMVFYEEHDLWRLATRKVGTDLLASALKIKHVPEDPSLN